VSDELHMNSDPAELEAGEVVTGVPVPAERPGAALPVLAATPPAVRAAAVGFLAGAAAIAVVQRRRSRPGRSLLRRRRRKGPFGEIVSSNSFLVDVHLIRR
jgi:hypothetical protein